MLWLRLMVLLIGFGCSKPEAPPNTDAPKTFEGPRFTLSYPGNWKIAKFENDYNPEHHFRIQSPGGHCNVMFVLYEPPVDLRPELEKISNQRMLIVGSPEVVPTHNWGRNVGQGIHIIGILDENPENRIHYQVFGMQRRLVTVTIVEECPEKRRAVAQAGFDLIASTFTLR